MPVILAIANTGVLLKQSTGLFISTLYKSL
nr:MAG TPA: hypothetical protein [Caudoviricetes sp.]